jgi:hypothetical protein
MIEIGIQFQNEVLKAAWARLLTMTCLGSGEGTQERWHENGFQGWFRSKILDFTAGPGGSANSRILLMASGLCRRRSSEPPL